MRLLISAIFQEIIDKCNLRELSENRWVYREIQKGLYRLEQEDILANQLLAKRLNKTGHHPCQFTPGLWRHVWRPITFALVVDDFGIKTVASNMPSTSKQYWKGIRGVI